MVGNLITTVGAKKTAVIVLNPMRDLILLAFGCPMLFLFYDGILEAIHIHNPGTAATLVPATLFLMIRWAIGSRKKTAQRQKQMHAAIENTCRLRAEVEREAAAKEAGL